MKITFMGAGSTVFARNVIGDCMCSEVLRDSVFALYDIDGQRLEESKTIIEAMQKTMGGCGGEKAEGPVPGTALSTFYQAVLEAQPEGAEELIFFEESNPELIASFYPGLEKIDLAQQAFYMPPIATHPCEIVLAEAKTREDAQAVAEIFRARIELGSDNSNYPESAEGWKLYA